MGYFPARRRFAEDLPAGVAVRLSRSDTPDFSRNFRRADGSLILSVLRNPVAIRC
jgi:hypothetical protein